MRKIDITRLPPSAARESAYWLKERFEHTGLGVCSPKIAIILGSGLNDTLQNSTLLQRYYYQEIPHFAAPTVQGHSGVLDIAEINAQQVAILRGRFHFYEGHSGNRIILPVRVMKELGVETLIVTNAAGGLNPAFRQGDLMVIQDHIGLPTLAGSNPLVGPNDDALGPRFVPMGEAYAPEYIQLAHEVAAEHRITLREGVYLMVSGPTYETPAEIRMMRILGADAVGMSTAPEVIAARHSGMKVLGISSITNTAAPETAKNVNHEEVLAGAQMILPRLNTLLTGILQRLTAPVIPSAPPTAVRSSMYT